MAVEHNYPAQRKFWWSWTGDTHNWSTLKLHYLFPSSSPFCLKKFTDKREFAYSGRIGEYGSIVTVQHEPWGTSSPLTLKFSRSSSHVGGFYSASTWTNYVWYRTHDRKIATNISVEHQVRFAERKTSSTVDSAKILTGVFLEIMFFFRSVLGPADVTVLPRSKGVCLSWIERYAY